MSTAAAPAAPPSALRRWWHTLTTPPTIATQAVMAMVLLCAQAGISVTGSIVRVTGSGLGCPTWPDCQPGSLVPQAGARPWVHQMIEFGNRLLTFVLAAIAITLLVAVIRAHRRRRIFWLTMVQNIGIVVQAIIGGISVRLQLAWWSVAMHFLPSMLLVFLAGVLWVEIREADDGARTRTYPRTLSYLAALSAAALAAVLATGTMVTGAGQHAGDAEAGQYGRLGIDLAYMANIHAHFMYLYLGMTIGLLFGLFTCAAPKRVTRTAKLLILVIVIQALIGIIQFNFHVPRWTVPFHVGLSGAVTGITGILYGMHMMMDHGSRLVTGSIAGDKKRKGHRAKTITAGRIPNSSR